VPLADYTEEVLADDPEFYWPCQEAAGALVDASGNGFDTNGSGNLGELSYGLPGPCGDDDAIAWDDGQTDAHRSRNAVPFVAVDNITLEWWLYRQFATNGTPFIIGNLSNTGVYFSFVLGAPRISVAGIAHLATFANLPPLNAWCHLVAVRRATVWEYYFNGTLDTGNVSTATPNPPDTQTWIGYFGGGIAYRTAHLAGYYTALTVGRIADHYNAATEVLDAGGSVNWHALGMR